MDRPLISLTTLQECRQGIAHLKKEPPVARAELAAHRQRLLCNIGMILRALTALKQTPEEKDAVRLFCTAIASLAYPGAGATLQYEDSGLQDTQTCTFVAHALNRPPYTPALSAVPLPGVVARYWLPVVAAWSAAVVLHRFAASYHVVATLQSISGEAWEAMRRFASEYVVRPVLAIYSTIRYDSAAFAVQSADSLRTDLDSLTRMVTAFAKDELSMSADQLEVLKQSVHEGDISVVLKSFESDIKTPIKAMVAGSMLRTVFIQIQKTKVDVEMAMSALDKIMRANELTFHLISAIPTVLFLRYLYGRLADVLSSRSAGPVFEGHASLKSELHTLAKAVNQSLAVASDFDRLANEGTVFVSLHRIATMVPLLLHSCCD
jgi:hypothetical protein